MIEFIGRYSAQIVATCSLWFTIYYAYQQRKHNKLSVRPHLSSFVQINRTDPESHIRLELQNNGLGPAFIKNFKIYVDNEPCTFSDALRFVVGNIHCKQGFYKFVEGTALPAGEIEHIVHVTFSNESSVSFAEVHEKFKRINVSVEYECAYGIAKKFDNFGLKD